MKRLNALFLVLLLCSAEALFGQGSTVPRNAAAPEAAGYFPFPKEISYQGLLTTSSGTPAADGIYTLQFDIFNVSGGGLSLWTETQTGVTVTRGVFSVRLGAVTPLPDFFYQVAYLEVAALAGPGIGGTVTFAPRTQLTAAAYSLAPWFTQGYNIYSPLFGNVMVGTDTADPMSKLLVKSHSRYAGRFETDSVSNSTDVLHAVVTQAGAADAVGVYGQSIPQDWWGIGGEFVGGYHGVNGFVFPIGGSTYTGVSGFVGGGGGSNVGVYGSADGGGTDYGVVGAAADSAANYAGYFSGRLRVLSNSGDSAAMFPDNAVSAPEILDEPGIAAHTALNSVTLTPGVPQALDSVTITLPAAGYVIVEAGGIINMNHTNGTIDNVWLDVSTTSGATPGGGFQWGYVDGPLPTGLYGSNFHNQRVYSFAAGTYSFFLNVRSWTGVDQYVGRKWIRATYFPTSYGPVTTIAGAGDASTAPVSAQELSDNPAGLPNQGGQEIDLRELEINALRARAQAEAAEKQLLEARLAKERQKSEMPDQR